MHYVAGPKYVEEPVAPRDLDEGGQEKTGQEVPASSLKDMDEKLGYKKKESEELAANGFWTILERRLKMNRRKSWIG